ncbi:HoxN/HupN/NixA family nickel/cobalt transporter [Streptomyces canarius]|uniref:Nickel/cobalt efflux system n=1 Tax=Streptomyces canarius TaxID=285453 RepID=A0ABQ3DDR9_9ACTN|nr:nickel/cobalt efflux system [Streptomyces canarius]
MSAPTLRPPSSPSRLSTVRRSLTKAEWSRLGGVFAAIAALHIIGWGILITVVAPHHFTVGQKSFGVGIGVTAYVLGMRHAFDADHIAAIDNTTRKLMNSEKRPLSVGFWFSLGHSSIVFALSLLLAFGIKGLAGPLQDDNSTLHTLASWVGTLVSGAFLYVIALINLLALAGIWKVFRSMRSGHYDETELEEHLNKRGFLNRILGTLTKSVTRPWQMYPLGLLFGLGFDTATEIALLVLAGSSAASGLPWYAILCLPVLFAAGMSLLDTIDGTFMNFAYGWAFSEPVRKVYYNLTITGLSVAVALLIGTVELLGLLADKLDLHGAFWQWIGGVNLNTVGFVIVGLFFATWVVALLVWKWAGVEERWSRSGTPWRAPVE